MSDPTCETLEGTGRGEYRRRAIGRGVTVLGWSFAVATLALWGVLRWGSVAWWPLTLFLYGPRWAWASPLVVLVPTALALRRRALVPLALATVILIGPVMGFRASLASGGYAKRPPQGQIVRVLSFNTQGGDHLAVGRLGAYLARIRPDIVLFQECAAPPESLFPSARGWHVRAHGQLCLASRYPVRAAEYLDSEGLETRGGLAHYTLEAPGRVLHAFNMHLPTPRDGLEAVISGGWEGVPILRESVEVQWHGSDVARRWVDRAAGPRILAGDFNMPDNSPIYRRYWSDFANAFGAAGKGFGYTKWTSWFGIRIDHVLADPPWRVRRCMVGPDFGSDHRPIVAELEWIGAGR